MAGASPSERKRLRKFALHLCIYFLVMMIAVPVNLMFMPHQPRVLFPLVAWGAPLALHAAWAMGLFDRGQGPTADDRLSDRDEVGDRK